MSKEAMRQAMPAVAQIVDEFRDLMSNGGKVIYAAENGHVIDRREKVNPDCVFVIPQRYREAPKEKK
jgi:hypothetical protein